MRSSRLLEFVCVCALTNPWFCLCLTLSAVGRHAVQGQLLLLPLACVCVYLCVWSIKQVCEWCFLPVPGITLTVFIFSLISSPLDFCPPPAEEASTAAIRKLQHVLWRWRQQRRIQRLFGEVLQLQERRSHPHLHEADRRRSWGWRQQQPNSH